MQLCNFFRLTATKIVGILGVCMEGDTCSQFDPFELVIGNRSQSNLYNSILTYTDSLKCRIDELKVSACNSMHKYNSLKLGRMCMMCF